VTVRSEASLRLRRCFLTGLAWKAAFGIGPIPALHAQVADSAGIRVVSLPAAPPASEPIVAATERFSTAGTVDLFRVTSAVFLEDGRLAVANAGSQEILFFDDGGVPVGHFGRKGEGPGEFSWIRAVGLTVDGKLWAYDDRLGRLTEVPGPGGEPRTRPVRPADAITSLEPLTVDWNGPVLAIRGEHRVFKMSGENRDTVPLFRVALDGAVDTLGHWPGLEKAFADVGNGAAQLQVGFGRTLFTGRTAGRAVLGSSDTLDLSVYDGSGRLRTKIVGSGPTVEVTEVAANAWRRERVEAVTEYPEIAEAYREVPIRSTYPVFDGLAVDRNERIWIGLHPADSDTQIWWIIGPNGPAGTVGIPAGGTVLTVTPERMAMLRRSALGEEYVVVYQVEP